MEKYPLISIIVPVYNQEKYLRQCIESVLAQIYENWELILVDDGSTDNSGSICDAAYSAAQSVKVIHKHRGGQSSARNAGLDRARGKYVLFLDADDIIHPYALSFLLSPAMGNNAEITVCKMQRFKDDTKLRSSFKWEMSTRAENRKIPFYSYPGKHMAEKMLYQKGSDASACGKLFLRSLWKKRRFRVATGYEDLDIVPVVTSEVKLAYECPLYLYFYRQHPDSYTHTFTLSRADMLTVAKRLERHFNDDRILKKAASDRLLSASFNMFALLSVNRNKIKDTHLSEADRIAYECWKNIKERRLKSLLNRRTRIKNKAGILLSYIGGRPLIAYLSRFFYT